MDLGLYMHLSLAQPACKRNIASSCPMGCIFYRWFFLCADIWAHWSETYIRQAVCCKWVPCRVCMLIKIWCHVGTLYVYRWDYHHICTLVPSCRTSWAYFSNSDTKVNIDGKFKHHSWYHLGFSELRHIIGRLERLYVPGHISWRSRIWNRRRSKYMQRRGRRIPWLFGLCRWSAPFSWSPSAARSMQYNLDKFQSRDKPTNSIWMNHGRQCMHFTGRCTLAMSHAEAICMDTPNDAARTPTQVLLHLCVITIQGTKAAITRATT